MRPECEALRHSGQSLQCHDGPTRPSQTPNSASVELHSPSEDKSELIFARTLSNSYQSQLDWNSVDGATIGHMERRFDEQGRLSGWTTANGSTPGYSYDENGHLLYETNSLGLVTQYTYDLVGRVITVTNLVTAAGTT